MLKAMLFVPEDKDDYHIEIYCDKAEQQVAEVYPVDGKLTIDVYCQPNGEPWTFDFDELRTVLTLCYDELNVD